MSELNMLLVVFCDSVSLLQTNICNELTSDVSRDSPFATVVSTFSATVCKTVRPMLSDRCLSCLSVRTFLSICDVGVLWPNGHPSQLLRSTSYN